MPNKRSKRKNTHKFFCTYCQQQLWRLGSKKHHLYYKNVAKIQERLQISHKNASFLAAQNNAYIDADAWIEEFFCEKHGNLWMLISRNPKDGTVVAAPARKDDWHCTTGTINPNQPNPSVSEFTYRMSRRTDGRKCREYQ